MQKGSITRCQDPDIKAPDIVLKDLYYDIVSKKTYYSSIVTVMLEIQNICNTPTLKVIQLHINDDDETLLNNISS